MEEICEENLRKKETIHKDIDLSKKDNKKIYLEILRIIAILLVVFNHTSQNGFLLFTVTENVILRNFYLTISYLCKMAVPIFFMISGALLIKKEEKYKDFFKKRVLKYIVIIILFQFIIYCFSVIMDPIEKFNILYFFKKIYTSNILVPYWFLYTYLGLLIILPFVRKMAINMKDNDYKYLFLIYIVFKGGVIQIIDYILFKGNAAINLNLTLVVEGVFYFLIGYYIEYRLKDRYLNKKYLLYMTCASLIAIIIMMCMANYQYIVEGTYTQDFLRCLIAIPTITTFIGIKKVYEEKHLSENMRKIIMTIGSCTFGVYLFEYPIRKVTEFICVFMMNFLPTIIASFIWVFLVFVIGTVLVWILKKMPIFRILI